ncbi:MAG: YbgC/FadM family acyl-CoA thioesterase [Hyphomonadaceae bacterium]|nr:YbgC/FadM family acyl-CoA thioesterase [Hyphomonadaceae bacterium]MBC6413296.1 YbgC/FadM family acyl-CoA thioesterase [Hyphomonadaceae bacterium]
MKEPSMGWFEGRNHHYPLRVFYEDTDFTGIVYYANYLRFFERARSSYFRLVGFEHARLWGGDDPMAFAIRKIELDYKKPARIDDCLIIITTYERWKGARLWVSQAAYRGEELLVTAVSEAASITPAGRPRRPPKWMIETLKPYLKPE